MRVKIDFGVDTYGRLYGQVGASSGADDVSFCYGIDAGYEVYVRATAPNLFPGLGNLDKYWTITKHEVPVLRSADNCDSISSSKRSLMAGQVPPEWMGQGIDVSPNPNHIDVFDTPLTSAFKV